jgi:C-terminal processing protease CtpA/Prc
MGALDAAQAPRQIAAEIAFFQSGTDALVIDVMHNQGGSVCYAENLAQYLMPRPFRGIASRLRATQEWANFFAHDLVAAVTSNAPQDIIDLYKSYLAQILVALNENRGLTAPLPICTPTFETVQPARDENGNLLAYTKPILVLVDELTRSAAENVPMFIQDEGRGLVLGVRTNGAGGAPATFPAGAYGGGSTTVTASMVTRAKPVSTEGFPTADVIENIGIYPDIFVDYMTRDNLMTGGKPFVAAFTQVVAEMIEKR